MTKSVSPVGAAGVPPSRVTYRERAEAAIARIEAEPATLAAVLATPIVESRVRSLLRAHASGDANDIAMAVLRLQADLLAELTR